jgi:hypothetical protein
MPLMNSGNKCPLPFTNPFRKNTVAPAQAGAHDVCLARPTGAIGPSLRWGDGGSRSGCHKAPPPPPPLQGLGDLAIPCRCAFVEGPIWYTNICTFEEWR